MNIFKLIKKSKIKLNKILEIALKTNSSNKLMRTYANENFGI